MKGIVLAGGTGTRLHPVTLSMSKQLVPVYNKPMIYYPLSVLMLAGIREILIVTTLEDITGFRRLLGDGGQWGLRLSYAIQSAPRGIADALIVGADHVDGEPVALVLGDNIFHGPGMSRLLRRAVAELTGAVLFGYPVADPQRYGIAEVDADGVLRGLVEKPAEPTSNLAVTGLYLYDGRAVDMALRLTPSARGELEITDLNRLYLELGEARVVNLGRGFAWLDAGTHESLLAASEYVRTLEERQGIRIACLEEIALRMGFISAADCYRLGEQLGRTAYGRYVMDVASAVQRAGLREVVR
ncbi:glucose-1-phosphate thymidylyltransferase RfbA [Actinocatenispora rupis]|uniref:glucose-1-phosphate thymidylyltransferase RfbA n=1 Tax=Actinocatenispora rupis TaxID=519421 RepID=UPI0019424D12|nr:glucose-1-phosphate thymidylyltransferase RfbA [Actinocatenispora rupis]